MSEGGRITCGQLGKEGREGHAGDPKEGWRQTRAGGSIPGVARRATQITKRCHTCSVLIGGPAVQSLTHMPEASHVHTSTIALHAG